MLRTTIQTTDEATGKEVPVPPDLRAKVQRADELLRADLAKLATDFDLEAQWRFERRPQNEFTVVLRLSRAGEAVSSEPRPADLDSDDTIRRWLWMPTRAFVNILSAQASRRVADAFRAIYATLDEWRSDDAGEIAQSADRGTLQTSP